MPIGSFRLIEGFASGASPLIQVARVSLLFLLFRRGLMGSENRRLPAIGGIALIAVSFRRMDTQASTKRTWDTRFGM
jgi:hypothetical protein